MITIADVVTETTYTADGSTSVFSIPFEYLSKSHVHVYLNGTETTDLEFTSTSSITLTTTPVSGVLVKIKRITPYNEAVITWKDGSIIFATDMNAQGLQGLFVLQENITALEDTETLINQILNNINLLITDTVTATTDQSDVDTQNTLAWWLNQLGSIEATINIARGTYSIANDLVIPSNINLKFNRGAILSVASGKTLTINGSIESGLWQIFSGEVTGNPKIIEVYAQWFGAHADGVTDDTSAISKAIDFCLKTYHKLYIAKGNYKFTTITVDIANYTALQNNYGAGFIIEGENKAESILNGELIFKGISPNTGYTSRIQEVTLKNLNCCNSNGNSLTFSSYGKCYIENCFIRGTNGIGLKLMGGSEVAAHNTDIFGSLTNLYIRATDLSGNTVDAAVINFYDCNIHNSQGTANIDCNSNDRAVYFTGGNIISTNNSIFTNSTVYCTDVDFENTTPILLTNSQMTVNKCQFAVASDVKIKITNTLLNVLDTIFDPTGTGANIEITDTSSHVDIVRSIPSIFIDHTTNTKQITFKHSLAEYANNTFIKQLYSPFSANKTWTVDTSNYITGDSSIIMASGGYATICTEKGIAAIELISSSNVLKAVVNGSLVDVNTLGTFCKLQKLNDVFNKYLLILRDTVDYDAIRLMFITADTKIDSFCIYAANLDSKYTILKNGAAPTVGTWNKGEIVYNSAPTAGGYVGWICVAAGSPGTWKGFGLIAS